MEEFWIIKRGPKNGYCSGDSNKCYLSFNEAVDDCKKIVSQYRSQFVVMKSVVAFEPACDIKEVKIERKVTRKIVKKKAAKKKAAKKISRKRSS